jgi:predicted glycoside hydrolase/deacetylase ChbG (UPF0249 family)
VIRLVVNADDLGHSEQINLGILETLPEGDSELGCHPGYADALRSTCTVERETEIATLRDTRVRDRVRALGIELIGWDVL